MVSHIQEQAVLHLSATVSLSALGEMGILSGTAGVGTLINNNICVFDCSVNARMLV